MKSMFTSRIVLGLFLLAFLAGCSSEQPGAPSAATEPNPQFLVSAAALMQTTIDPNTIIVHVSATNEKFNEGHLPSARFLNLDGIAINAENVQRDLPAPDSLPATFQRIGVNNESRVILYDDSNGMAATRAFFALDYLGFTNMAVLDGGLNSWTAAGGTISSTVSPTTTAGNLTASLNEGRFVTASQVNEAREQSVLIDARSEGEFSGTDPGNTITRGGHIPGAVHLDWSSHLKEDGTLKSMEELKALYHVAEGKHTIVYCRTGMKASHSYFVARLIGLDVSLYDGSFYDWSNMTDYPVETGL